MIDRSSWKSIAFGAVAAIVVGGLFGGGAHSQSTSYSYDGLGRLRNVTYSDGKTISYVYDAAGNRTERLVAGEGVTPNTFDLGPAVTNATAGALYASATPTLTGFNSPSPISISGGQYRIDGGAWTSVPSTVRAGQTVQVQVQAPASGGASQTATLNVGGVNGSFTVTTLAAPDYTPDPIVFADISGWTNDNYTATETSRIQVTGINQPVALRATVTSQTGNLSVGGIYLMKNSVSQNPVQLWGLAGGEATTAAFFENGDVISIIMDAQTYSGVRSGTARVTISNDTTGGTAISNFLYSATVDADNNYNIPDYTPDPLNWGDLFPSFRGPPSSQPTPPKFVDSATLTIAGLTPSLSITLGFAQDNISPAGSGLLVIVYKNGVALSPLSLSIADGLNSSRGPAGLNVSVTNGDTIRFRAEVFDSAIARNSGNSSSRSARQLIYNQTTNTVIDTFDIYGSYTEPTYCGQFEC